MKTFLMLATLAMFPRETPPSERALDWKFVDAQERWVLENHGVRSAIDAAPVHVLSIYRAMASSDYRRRDAGSRRMREMGQAAIRWCYVGQHLGDPEVSLRCRNVLRVLSECGVCRGRGGCEEAWGWSVCLPCKRRGHFSPPEDLVDER